MNSIKTHIFEVLLPEYGILAQSRQKRLTEPNDSHSHSTASILFIVDGCGIVEFENERFEIGADSIITLPENLNHKIIDNPRKQMTIFSVYFDQQKAGLNKNITDYLLNSDEPFTLPVYYSENIKRHLRQILYEQNTKPPGYKLSIKQNLSLALVQIYRARLDKNCQIDSAKQTISSERVKSVLEFISQNCHEQYGLADAARLAKVSQRQFTNLCRNLTGESFIKYLNSKRCQKAAELLKETQMHVAAIAFETGYEDLSTFYRAFKKNYKQSPNQFKNS